MEENLLKTCLYDKHVALGALMSPFGGFIMPIQYSSITEEHNAVRNNAGMFDVSHMGEIFVSGPDAEKSGRNDVLVNGRKVSGNAFHQLPDRSIVHGTLLYSTDFDALEQALLPPVEKLQRHGVESVRQRVMNLSEILSCGIETIMDALTKHFCDSEAVLSEEDVKAIEKIQEDYFVITNKKH